MEVDETQDTLTAAEHGADEPCENAEGVGQDVEMCCEQALNPPVTTTDESILQSSDTTDDREWREERAPEIHKPRGKESASPPESEPQDEILTKQSSPRTNSVRQSHRDIGVDSTAGSQDAPSGTSQDVHNYITISDWIRPWIRP